MEGYVRHRYIVFGECVADALTNTSRYRKLNITIHDGMWSFTSGVAITVLLERHENNLPRELRLHSELQKEQAYTLDTV